MRRQIMVILHFFTFCHPEAASPMTCGKHLVLHFFTFLSSRGGGPDDMREPFGPALFHLLSSRGGGPDGMRGTIWSHTFFHYPETIKSDSAQRQIIVIRAFRRPRGTNSTVSEWCVGTDHFQNFCRFHWQGDWLAKWCFARTKLVSYLYFPFISNKRQVKKGNCHTLISLGDHSFVGMRPSFDHFEVLSTHR